ncbi:MAG TPA: hypothetical protein DCE52_02970 [Rhodobacteraceae bacterium]|nr:hypothetical protein [Paracoccaceae bacterium]
MKKVLILSVLLFSGCVTYEPAPTSYQLQSAYFGERPTYTQVKDTIEKVSHATLKDPFSAQYIYSPPRKAWTYYQFKVHYGYAVEYKVNARNGFGAYGGFKPNQFIYNSGNITPAQFLNYAHDPEAFKEWEASKSPETVSTQVVEQGKKSESGEYIEGLKVAAQSFNQSEYSEAYYATCKKNGCYPSITKCHSIRHSSAEEFNTCMADNGHPSTMINVWSSNK